MGRPRGGSVTNIYSPNRRASERPWSGEPRKTQISMCKTIQKKEDFYCGYIWRATIL